MIVHVIGAGPSGIALSYFCTKNDIESVVYERNKAIGGMARSWSWKDCVLDTGPHIFHTPDETIKDIWTAEASDLLEVSSYRAANLLSDGTLHPYPVSYESISELPEYHSILHELDSLKGNPIVAKTFKDYVSNKMGPTLAAMFFEGYPEKLWGIPTDQMLANWAPQRISLQEKVSEFYAGQYAATGRIGTGSVMERFAAKSAPKSTYLLGTNIDGISVTNGRITALQANGKNNHIDDTDYVVSTLPISLLARILGIESTLRFRGVHTTYLKISASTVLPEPYSWVYIPDMKYPFNRITEASKLSSKVCDPSSTLLSIESVLPGGPHETTYLSALADQVKSSIYDSNILGISQYMLEDYTFNYEPYVYPINDLGSREELARLTSMTDNISNLITLGCGGEFHYGDMQIFFSKAQDIANDLSGRGDCMRLKPIVAPKANSYVSSGTNGLFKPSDITLIAEIGLNHCGNVELAYSMIDAAKASGANIVKFQLYNPDSRISSHSRESRYAETSVGEECSLAEELERARLSYDDADRLISYCRQRNTEILFTAFDAESLRFLLSQGAESVKVASMDLNNIQLHREIASSPIKKVYFSTGMSTMDEIAYVIDIYKSSGKSINVMHCSSVYPLDDSDVNLSSLHRLRSILPNSNYSLGYSDHTSDNLTSLLSVQLGTSVIERHFTTDRRLPGPDNPFSLTPSMMLELRNSLDRIAVIYGSDNKTLLPSEMKTYRSQKKGLYYKSDFKKGTKLTIQNMKLVAPPYGMSPIDFDRLEVSVLQKDVLSNTPCKEADFG